MDSLTQITLGAAVGELILGKKIGNRAIFWGAVGGTIPDLDVLFSSVLTPIQDLAFHRGFSHSIVFSIIGALGMGYAVDWIYRSKFHKYFGFIGWLLIPLAVLFFIHRIFEGSTVSNAFLIGIFGLLTFWLYRRYFKKEIQIPQVSVREWQWLFFGALFTHPLLDCFTTYGTQLFQPFSSYRVAFCTVSVVDPIYTVPFLICIIIISMLSRSNVWRRRLAWIGIGLSSTYLLFTVVNKLRVENIWKQSLQAQGIKYNRLMTSPTILNNVLWYCLAETEEGYESGLYSIFDSEKKVRFKKVANGRSLINPMDADQTINTLKWFCNGYYCITERPDGLVQFNDMRFGVFDNSDSTDAYIFNFPLEKNNSGLYEMAEINGGPPRGKEKEMLANLWTRIKGI